MSANLIGNHVHFIAKGPSLLFALASWTLHVFLSTYLNNEIILERNQYNFGSRFYSEDTFCEMKVQCKQILLYFLVTIFREVFKRAQTRYVGREGKVNER